MWRLSNALRISAIIKRHHYSLSLTHTHKALFAHLSESLQETLASTEHQRVTSSQGRTISLKAEPKAHSDPLSLNTGLAVENPLRSPPPVTPIIDSSSFILPISISTGNTTKRSCHPTRGSEGPTCPSTSRRSTSHRPSRTCSPIRRQRRTSPTSSTPTSSTSATPASTSETQAVSISISTTSHHSR